MGSLDYRLTSKLSSNIPAIALSEGSLAISAHSLIPVCSCRFFYSFLARAEGFPRGNVSTKEVCGRFESLRLTTFADQVVQVVFHYEKSFNVCICRPGCKVCVSQ